MAEIDKGMISAFKDDGAKAEVIPSSAKDSVTAPLTVPMLLRGNLSVNTEVVYAMFEDNTGIIIDRLDGKNTHQHEYTHGGMSSGTDKTGGPI